MAYSAEFYAKRNALAESLMADGWEEEEAYQYADGEIAKQLSPTQMQASPISAASSTAAPSTAMQIVQRLQTKGIDPSFATTAQLEEARQAIGAPPIPAAQVVSATSGGMAAPSNLVTVPDTPSTGDGEAWQPGTPGYTYDPATVAIGSDGRYYAITTDGNLQMVAGTNGMTGGFGAGTQLQEGANAAATKAMVDQQFANQGGGSFLGDIGELLGGGLSALQEAAPGIALVGGAGLLGGAFPSIYSGLGAGTTLAPTAATEALAAEGGMFGLPTAAAPAVEVGGAGQSFLIGDAAADTFGASLPAAVANAPDAIAAIDAAITATGASTATEAAATLGYGSTEAMIAAVNPALVAGAAAGGGALGVAGGGAATSGITLPQAGAGASLAGTAATLGGGVDQVGSDWASLGINPDGTINQDVMNGGLLPADPNTGLVLPNFQASPSGTGNQALDDFLRSQGGTYDSIAQAPSGVPLSDVASIGQTGFLDSLSNSDLLKLGLPIAGAALGGLSGASQAGTTTSVQDLPDWLKPYVTGNLDAAKAYMAANPQDNSLLDPARAELNKTIAGDYLNSNPANAFYSGAQNYVNPGIAGMQAGASGAYVGQNPGDAGYREAQNYINPGIAALQSGASGSFMGLNPADAGYRAAQNYTNQGIAALQPGARGDYVGTNPADAYYKQAANFTNSGIDFLRPAASGAYVGQNPSDAGYRAAQGYTNPGIDLLNPAASGAYLGLNPSDPYYRNAANYTNTSMDYLRPTAEGKFLNANPYIDAIYAKARDAVGTGIDSRFSKAGRYGSGAHQGVLGTTFDNLATDIYGNNYAQERQNMLSAGGTLISADQAQQAARLAGASGLSGNYQNDRATQLAAAGNLGTLSQAQQAARLAGTAGLSGNYQSDRAAQLAAAGNLGTLEQAQQAARLAGAQGLGTNYANERNLQFNYGQALSSVDAAQQAARLAGTQGLATNYNTERSLQANYAQNQAAAEQAQQAARLAGTAGLSSNYNQDRSLQYNYGQAMTAAEQAQQAARLAGASGLSSNWNAARNNQLTAATSAPGFTADAATSPFAAFNAFGNLTKGLGVSQTSSPYFTNPVGGALSGALAGYGLSKAFG